MPSQPPPPIQIYATETLTENSTPELTLEANIDSSKFATQDWASKLIISNLLQDGTLITGVKYQDLIPLVPQSYAETFGAYTATSVTNRYAGFITIDFARHKDAAAKRIPWRITQTFGNHYWHPILDTLVFIEDHTFPRSTNGGRGASAIITGPTYYSREVYRPSISEGSRFIKKEYFADTPFLVPRYRVPIPSSVSVDLPGLRMSFPECLHPKLVIPDTQTATAAFVLGNKSFASGALQGQKFPETNFTERQDYVVGVDQQFKNGGWNMGIIVVQPPIDDTLIIK